MQIVYTRKPIISNPKSIFLAGPSPRERSTKSWRPQAVSILQQLKFDGVVYLPEHEDDRPFLEPSPRGEDAYASQCEWEWDALHGAGCILFWVPRNKTTMLALTTNIEFGFYVTSGRAFYGRPDEAWNNGYLDWLYGKITGRSPENDLENLLKNCIQFLEHR